MAVYWLAYSGCCSASDMGRNDAMTTPTKAENPSRQTTDELIQRAREMVERMTPEEYAAMIEAQRQSFIRAMAPCEHGDPDWETCPECLALLAQRSKP